MNDELLQRVAFKKVGKYDVSNALFLDLILNNNCNFNCPFCISNTKSFSCEDFIEWKKSLKKTFETFDIANIVILGGESTVDPLFFDKMAFLKEVIRNKNVKNVILTTNGYMLKFDYFLDKVIDSCITTINLSYMHYDKMKNDGLMRGKTLTPEELRKIYKKLKNNGMTMRLNCNCYKEGINSAIELGQYVKHLGECADVIKFSPLMKTDMFDTKEDIREYSNKVCFDESDVKIMFDEFASQHQIVAENSNVFGLLSYKELLVYDQHVILKYEQVEDKYDLNYVIPTLKLYNNGNLSNEWDYKKNILVDL